MLDRQQTQQDEPAQGVKRTGRLRYALAFVAVVAALLAASAMLKRETCDCSGPGVPYGTIAVAAAIAATAAFGAYLSIGLIGRNG